MRRILIVFVILGVGTTADRTAQDTTKKRKLLVIGQSKGYQHDSVSTAMATLYNLGRSTGTVGHVFQDRLHGHHQENAEVGRQEPECL